jgi:hypothetical protein
MSLNFLKEQGSWKSHDWKDQGLVGKRELGKTTVALNTLKAQAYTKFKWLNDNKTNK